MSSFIRSLFILASGTSLVLVAAEPIIKAGTLETPLGETSYFQMIDSTPTGKPTSIVQVKNPNREYSIVKVTYEVGENGAKNKLRVRNGYDVTVFFALNEGCLHIAEPASPNANKEYALLGAPPERETSMDFAASTRKILMCDFTIGR